MTAFCGSDTRRVVLDKTSRANGAFTSLYGVRGLLTSAPGTVNVLMGRRCSDVGVSMLPAFSGIVGLDDIGPVLQNNRHPARCRCTGNTILCLINVSSNDNDGVLSTNMSFTCVGRTRRLTLRS